MNLKSAQRLRDLQRRLELFYGVEQAPDIVPFVRSERDPVREAVLLREFEGEVEIAVLLTEESLLTATAAAPGRGGQDGLAQIFEGISHFIYLAERARMQLPTTQLELELQAEVDKFVLFSLELEGEEQALRSLHAQLYEDVRFLHSEDSEAGARYRLANLLAARFVARSGVRKSGVLRAREQLRRFYRAGQAEKIHLARAA